jgi:hypothetical protein
MKPFARCFCFVMAGYFLAANSSPAADTNPPPRLTVELRDGSRVVGDSAEKYFTFRSALMGEMKLNVKDIRAVECVSSNSAKLSTANGDSLTVSIVDSQLAVKTSFGRVELPVKSVRKFSVAAGGGGAYPPGLVALWSGEGNAKDSVNGHDAIESSEVTYSQAKIGMGFDFEGSSSEVVVPTAPELNFGPGQDFSITAWIMPRHAPENSPPDEMIIVYKRYAPNAFNYVGYTFYVANGGQLYFLMGDAPMKVGGLIVNAGPDLRDGKFHHVAVTVQRNLPDGGHLYVDGECVLTFDPTQQNGSLSNDEPLRIGNQHTPGYRSPFKGLIDEVAIYNRALSASEIQTICTEQNGGEPLPPPSAHATVTMPFNGINRAFRPGGLP